MQVVRIELKGQSLIDNTIDCKISIVLWLFRPLKIVDCIFDNPKRAALCKDLEKRPPICHHGRFC